MRNKTHLFKTVFSLKLHESIESSPGLTIVRPVSIMAGYFSGFNPASDFDFEHGIVGYYNAGRTHASLAASTPSDVLGYAPNKSIDLAAFRWKPHCGGLFQLPVAA